eukprot:Sspe_Gene.107207::Locus_85303_Transcript_2_3_Confidence_0.625_Length_1615::g.107207::m.107207
MSVRWLAVVSVVVAGCAHGARPSPQLFNNTDCISGRVPQAGLNGTGVVFLGIASSVGECSALCMALDDCHSFAYHLASFGNPWRYGCYGVVDYQWSAIPTPGVVSGLIDPMPAEGECLTDTDCSLNGVCEGGKCRCDAAWQGQYCETLALLPTHPQWGYNASGEGSWGGTALRGDDGRYHMWGAGFTNGCSVGLWLCNSFIFHAVSDTPLGEYRRREVVVPVFSHEPRVVRAPTGEFVMYYTSSNGSLPCAGHAQCKCGTDGTPIPPCDSGRDWGVALPTKMIWATSPDGPWSNPVEIPQLSPLIDTNMSPVILPDGSVVGLFRNDGPTANLHVVRAGYWKDPSSYRESSLPIGSDGPEDPFVWRDHRGNWHSLHHTYPFASGTHRFSRTGSGIWLSARGSSPAYTPLIQFADGTSHNLTRRERPALVFDHTGTTPIALTNGCGFGDLMTHTCLQPLKTP